MHQLGWIAAQNAPQGVVAGCTTRFGGASLGDFAETNLAGHVGDDATAVATNRKLLSRQLGAPHMQWLQQVHGKSSLYVNAATCETTPVADAMWTDQRAIGLGILTADCVPILLWRTDASVIVAVHAGWRGLCAGVIEQTVAQLPPSAASLHAWIGPCMSVAHYEVGEEVWSQFVDWPAEHILLPHPRQANKRMLDLSVAAGVCLARSGVSQVAYSGLCTFSDPRFYSFRGKSGVETGRLASVVMLA